MIKKLLFITALAFGLQANAQSQIPSVITENAIDSISWSTPWKIQEWLDGYGLIYANNPFYNDTGTPWEQGQANYNNWQRGKAWLFERDDNSKFVMMQYPNDQRWVQIQKSQKCDIDVSWHESTCALSIRWITDPYGMNIEDFITGQLGDTVQFQDHTELTVGGLYDFGYGDVIYTGSGNVPADQLKTPGAETFYHFYKETSEVGLTFNMWIHRKNATNDITVIATDYLKSGVSHESNNLWNIGFYFESDEVFKNSAATTAKYGYPEANF